MTKKMGDGWAPSASDLFIDKVLTNWLELWAEKGNHRYGKDPFSYIGECFVTCYCYRNHPLLEKVERIAQENRDGTKEQSDSSTEDSL